MADESAELVLAAKGAALTLHELVKGLNIQLGRTMPCPSLDRLLTAIRAFEAAETSRILDAAITFADAGAA